MTPEIAPLAPAHLGALAEIEALCFSQPWSREALAEELGSPCARFLTALVTGEAVGYVGAHAACGEFYMDNLAVHPAHRRQGVARALLLALISLAEREGGAFLTLEVRPSNEAALGLYQSLGFWEAGRRKGFYEKPKEDALILRLDLQKPQKGEALCSS